MDLKMQSVRYHQFYYAGQPGTGQMVTCSSSTDKAVRNTVKNICCTLNYTGTAPETRLVWSTELGSYCKAYLRPDGRNYFYHILIPDPETVNAENLADAALRNTKPAQVSHELKELPVLTEDVGVRSPDVLRLIVQNDVTVMTAFLQCAFRPFLFRGITSRLSVPAEKNASEAYCLSADAQSLAALLLAVLPDSMRNKARLRFSSSPEEYAKMYDCTHAVLTEAPDANFVLRAPLRPGVHEDNFGLFAAMAEYICNHGIVAYRRTVCPVIDRWFRMCVGVGEIRLSSLVPLLQCETALRFEGQFAVVRELEYYLIYGNENWFDGYAEALCKTMRSDLVCMEIRDCLLRNVNALSERTPEQMKGKENDGFLRILAGTYRFASDEEKRNCLEIFYNRYTDKCGFLQIAYAMKDEMGLCYTVSDVTKPEELFAGTRILELRGGSYLRDASRFAVGAFVKDGDTQWLEELKPLLREPAFVKTVVGQLLGNFEELTAKCADMDWLHFLCKNYGFYLSDSRKKEVMDILRQKKLGIEELQTLGRELKMSDEDIPQSGRRRRRRERKQEKYTNGETSAGTEPVRKENGSLRKMSDCVAAAAGKKNASWKTSVLEKLITLLAGDCIWQELRTDLPKILDAVEFDAENRLHGKIELALVRQMAMQAPFVCDSADGKADYLHFVEKMRDRYALILYPQTELTDSRLRCGGKVPVSAGDRLKKLLWILPLILVTAAGTGVLFCMPAGQEDNFPQMLTAVCMIVAGVGALFTQMLMRREKTALYLLPSGTVAALLGILYFLFSQTP